MAFSRSVISKSIGWDQSSVPLPSLNTVESLIEKAKNNDEAAAREIFRLYRFGQLAQSEEERKVVGRLCEAVEELFV